MAASSERTAYSWSRRLACASRWEASSTLSLNRLMASRRFCKRLSRLQIPAKTIIATEKAIRLFSAGAGTDRPQARSGRFKKKIPQRAPADTVMLLASERKQLVSRMREVNSDSSGPRYGPEGKLTRMITKAANAGKIQRATRLRAKTMAAESDSEMPRSIKLCALHRTGRA